jgi:predicted DNA-binding transcriptional regulator YafY
VLKQTTKDNASLLSSRIAVTLNNEHDPTSHHLTDLQLALTNFNLVKMEYESVETDQVTSRMVEPFALLSTQGNWLLLAWCRLRKDFRLFRLDRIKNLHIRDEKFEPHKMTLQEYFEKYQNYKSPLT